MAGKFGRISASLLSRKESSPMNFGKAIAVFAVGLILSIVVIGRSFQTMGTPGPVLVFVGPEQYSAGGKNWTRYMYQVENFAAYPNELFAAAPALPPCGANTNASRTWVDFYDSRGKRLNGFCALKSADDLNKIWFSVETDVVPPSWVYIELTDRQTNTKYKSGLADTVQ